MAMCPILRASWERLIDCVSIARASSEDRNRDGTRGHMAGSDGCSGVSDCREVLRVAGVGGA